MNRRRPAAERVRLLSWASHIYIGLLANAALGAWLLDPIVGLLIARLAVKEGREAWRGEGCACH